MGDGVSFCVEVPQGRSRAEEEENMSEELERRVATLEAIVIAMCSNKPFAISLDEDGRPMVMTQIPSAALGGGWTDVQVAIKTHQQEQE